jgi:FdrA protein
MVVLTKVLRNTYRDSVLLMKMASRVRDMDGVENAEVMVATESNKAILFQTPLFTDDVKKASANDLVICVMAKDEGIAKKVIHNAEEMVMQGTVSQEIKQIARSMNSALAMLPGANLAIISIPGLYVRKEALKALKKGLNLLIFSNNVPIEDEIEIKKLAVELGLLVMGPDCGTAILHGSALAFANKVREGPIGLIGASGTGLQEVSVLIHYLGMGISHAIGTGTNDVADQVGGLSMIQGIKWLEADPTTEIIAVVSKPPSPQTMEKVLLQLKQCRKPVIANFLGIYKKSFDDGNILFTATLEETALKAVERIGRQPRRGFDDAKGALAKVKKKIDLGDEQKYIRGLFSGGTLAAEACIVLQEMVSPLAGNISLSGVKKLTNAKKSEGHSIIDLGADEFTLGKPHPMIEPEMRKERLLAEAKDPEVAVILLDFVLGYGTHPDPVGATIPHLEKMKKIAQEDGRTLAIVSSVCGTDEDPQGRSVQIRLLEEHGVIVLPNNAQAARSAALIALRS